MIKDQRIIFSDNGVLSDKSIDLNDYRLGTFIPGYTTGQDYLYIGSLLPFNHKYFDLGTLNAVAASVSVDIWWSNTWYPAVDILDRTSVSGASLAQSGVIQWNTDRLKGWDRELDSADVTGLTGTTIYDMYWVRLSWDATLTAGTVLKFIGHKFSNDDQLYSYYPDLNQTGLKEAFDTGKTDWTEQHFQAAEIIIRDLIKQNVIRSGAQILDFEKFVEPSIHKVAELVYQALGDAYKDNKADARKIYKETMDMKYFNVDSNADGSLSGEEITFEQGYLYR